MSTDTAKRQANDQWRQRAHERLDNLLTDAERNGYFGNVQIRVNFHGGVITHINRTTEFSESKQQKLQN